MTRIRKITLSLLLGTALVAGCAETPSNTNRNTGALFGAAVGGLVGGPLSGNGAKGAVIGAAAGGALGGVIGNRLDQQAAELDRDLSDSISVTNQGNQLLVNFPNGILFAVDSTAIASGQRQDLNTLAANLMRYPDTTIEVVGHTDNTGSAAHNFDLSARRAGAVASVLVANGVPGSRVTATGRGEDAPVATNLTEEGRALNRRVEVYIRPNS